MRVKMTVRSMSVDEYEPICIEMLNWLKEQDIKHEELLLEWYIMPSHIEFYDTMDAIVFKLKFDL